MRDCGSPSCNLAPMQLPLHFASFQKSQETLGTYNIEIKRQGVPLPQFPFRDNRAHHSKINLDHKPNNMNTVHNQYNPQLIEAQLPQHAFHKVSLQLIISLGDVSFVATTLSEINLPFINVLWFLEIILGNDHFHLLAKTLDAIL